MATRVQKIRECDRGGCRRRKGVDVYRLVLYEREIESVAHQVKAEICPAHVEMVIRYMDNLVKNTKEYPESELPEELT